MGLKEQSSEGVKQNLTLRSCWQWGVLGLNLMDEYKWWKHTVAYSSADFCL